jgi:exodeoxyribonuclease III
MKIISYNVNGIRAALNKNLTGWLTNEKPDIVCLQEIKAQPGQFDNYLFKSMGYHTYWHPAEKKGYSGVAILSKEEPLNVVEGCGETVYDCEGRVLRADFGDWSIVSLYMPSGTTGEIRQNFKMGFCDFFYPYVENLLKERPKLIVSGDMNICNHPIDIHDPVGNKKSSGFLPEERDWMSRFIDMGFVDSFRYLKPDEIKYSWWSQRFNSRAKNKGWRIDYHLVSKALADKIEDVEILNDAVHSDHCPVMVEMSL